MAPDRSIGRGPEDASDQCGGLETSGTEVLPIDGTVGFVRTAIPGLEFDGPYAHVAAVADGARHRGDDSFDDLR